MNSNDQAFAWTEYQCSKSLMRHYHRFRDLDQWNLFVQSRYPTNINPGFIGIRFLSIQYSTHTNLWLLERIHITHRLSIFKSDEIGIVGIQFPPISDRSYSTNANLNLHKPLESSIFDLRELGNLCVSKVSSILLA